MSLGILIIILVIVVMLMAMTNNPEAYCSCTGVSTMTNKPTYFVYRPTGDVSDSSCKPNKCSATMYNNQCKLQSVSVQQPAPLLEFSNLGWKTTPGTDTTMFGNSWTAGGGCNSSSVPLVSMSAPPQNCSSSCTAPSVVLTSSTKEVPYAQNYGSSSCTLRTLAGTPLISSPAPCNIKLTPTPRIPYVGPAGPYTLPSSKCCGGADAYNLSTGVL